MALYVAQVREPMDVVRVSFVHARVLLPTKGVLWRQVLTVALVLCNHSRKGLLLAVTAHTVVVVLPASVGVAVGIAVVGTAAADAYTAVPEGLAVGTLAVLVPDGFALTKALAGQHAPTKVAWLAYRRSHLTPYLNPKPFS